MSRWPLWGAVVIALAATAMFGAVSTGETEVQTDVGPEVFITDSSPERNLDAKNSPGAAVNPRNRDNVVVVNRVDAPKFSAELHWSLDGGQTWATTDLPLPEGTGKPDGPPIELGADGRVRFVETQRPFAPDVAFAPDGTLYVSYVNLMGRGNSPANLWLARSDDGGATLSQPVRATGEQVYQARLAVDHDGVVHIVYLQADSVGVFALTSPAPVVAIRSSDGGQTFTEPVVVSEANRLRVAAATPVIDAAGDLVVLYQDFKDNVRDFMNLEGPAWERPSALVVTRSTDGGRSFSSGVEVDAEVVVGKRFVVFLPEFPAIAAGPEGELYVAWADARNGSHDVLLRRSVDGGLTWAEAVRVNDNPIDDHTSQYLPAVAVAGNGRVDVVYLDRRHDPDDVMTAVSLAASNDAGASFDTLRLSSQAFDATIGPPTQETYTDPGVGSRLGLVNWDHGALAVWTDTRVGDDQPELARQDIVAARAALADTGSLSARRHWLVTLPLVALGVLAAGALAVAVRRQTGHRPGGAMPE